jgi:hypothetical protein
MQQMLMSRALTIPGSFIHAAASISGLTQKPPVSANERQNDLASSPRRPEFQQ